MSESLVRKKIIKKRKEEDVKQVAVLSKSSDVDDLLTDLKKIDKQAIIPKDENDSLIQVADWLDIPSPIKKVIASKGLPMPSVVMAQGKEDCGKTTFSVECMTRAQQSGGVAVFFDSENKFNLKRAKAMGLDVSRMIIYPATSIEFVFQKSQELAAILKKSNTRAVIVWDSLGATPTEKELDSGNSEFAMLAAKEIKAGLRRMVQYLRNTKIAFIIINHLYDKPVSFGKKTASSGGSGPRYHASIILEFCRISGVRPKGKKEGDFAGRKIQIECVKNHVSQPFKKVETEIDWKGFAVGREIEYAPEGYFNDYEEGIED